MRNLACFWNYLSLPFPRHAEVFFILFGEISVFFFHVYHSEQGVLIWSNFVFSNSFHALASVNHFDWPWLSDPSSTFPRFPQEEGLASPENMDIDAALLPIFLESETYRFAAVPVSLSFLRPPPKSKLEYAIGGPKLCWAKWGPHDFWRRIFMEKWYMHMLRSQKQVRPSNNMITSCRYNQRILAECGVRTEHGSLVQDFFLLSVHPFLSLNVHLHMTIIYYYTGARHISMYIHAYTYIYVYYESQPVGLAEVISASEASLGGPGGERRNCAKIGSNRW